MKSQTLNSAHELEKFSPDNFCFAACFFVRTEMFFPVALLGTRVTAFSHLPAKTTRTLEGPYPFPWLLSLTSEQIIR